MHLIILFAAASFVLSNSTLNAMFSTAYVCSTIINVTCSRTIRKKTQQKKHFQNYNKLSVSIIGEKKHTTKVKIKCQHPSDGLNNPQSEEEFFLKKKISSELTHDRAMCAEHKVFSDVIAIILHLFACISFSHISYNFCIFRSLAGCCFFFFFSSYYLFERKKNTFDNFKHWNFYTIYH